MIKISLVDDEVLFLNGMVKLLSQHDRIEICNSYSSSELLIDDWKSNAEKPDIVLVDMKLPGLNGIELTQFIMEHSPEVKVIGLSSHYSRVFIFQMLKLGAAAYLPKNAEVERLVRTIENVHNEGFYFDDIELKTLKNSTLGSKEKREFLFHGLSERELEVLLLICEQYKTQDIADKLFISAKTVEQHRAKLLLKTESKNVVGLVLFALKFQLVGHDSV